MILPGATLGVVGGGQLGRMFAQAAQRAGYAVAVLDPDADGPAAQVADRHVRGAYDDPAAIDALAAMVAAATTEFENVPAATLDRLAARVPVAPAGRAVAVCQDRAAEKAAFAAAGLAVAPHAVLASEGDVARAAAEPSLFPGILKTARLGYDGKGQAAVRGGAELAAAFAALGGVPCVLERRLALVAEVSVVVARGADGAVVHLPVQENVHAGGVLAATRVPAALPEALQREAVALATRMAEALGYVGVLCLECFVIADGDAVDGLALVANEMAPRPHNSGHHSIESADVSQFELQWRALVRAPLVPPRLATPAVLLNLLGDLWQAGPPDWPAALAIPGAHLHLYGKAEARAGRKMGHLTLTAPTVDEALANARRAARALRLDAAPLDRLGPRGRRPHGGATGP